MTDIKLSETLKKKVLAAQRSELTEYYIYRSLAASTKNGKNKKILSRIADDELTHHDYWKNLTGEPVLPNRWKISFYVILSRVLGLTFGIKLMEQGERKADISYRELQKDIPRIEQMIEDEEIHEQDLIQMIDEERLRYVSSMVLGLNDALVELTGALAGFTFALQKTRIVAVAGLITGIAASFSMATSEYLSKKHEKDASPLKSSLYTGGAYILTVLVLISPYFLLQNPFSCLLVVGIFALVIICAFTFYTSVAQDLPFWNRFREMALLAFGVTVLNFLIGLLMRKYLDISI